jgi:hypothetical protein
VAQRRAVWGLAFVEQDRDDCHRLILAKVAFTGEDWARDVIRNLNADGFSSPYLRYKGGHPLKFTLGQRWEIKKIAKFKILRGRCSAWAATDRPTGVCPENHAGRANRSAPRPRK